MLPHGFEMTGDRAVDQRARLIDRVSGRNTPRRFLEKLLGLSSRNGYDP